MALVSLGLFQSELFVVFLLGAQSRSLTHSVFVQAPRNRSPRVGSLRQCRWLHPPSPLWRHPLKSFPCAALSRVDRPRARGPSRQELPRRRSRRPKAGLVDREGDHTAVQGRTGYVPSPLVSSCVLARPETNEEVGGPTQQAFATRALESTSPSSPTSRVKSSR